MNTKEQTSRGCSNHETFPQVPFILILELSYDKISLYVHTLQVKLQQTDAHILQKAATESASTKICRQI